jgi:Serpentine type 7TM GPCR chemoreceptor Str
MMPLLPLQIMIINSGAVVVYGVGPLALNGHASSAANKWNFACISAWYYMVLVSQCSVAVHFLYRYFAVCRLGGVKGW